MSGLNKEIRNFVIIAHIDHGKSTLADRFLEMTKTINKGKLVPQFLDRMNLEKKHGITIKMHPVRMYYQLNNKNYELNLIDTPGHVDFTYEVSRALAAVEGAILLVDGTQGLQAQTLSNLYASQKQGLKIIGAINKIDLDIANINNVIQELADLIQTTPDRISLISAKNGQGVENLLERVIREIPSPKINIEKRTRALIFDSQYDYYRGVIAYVRIVDGRIKKGDRFVCLANKVKGEIVDLGYFAPELKSLSQLESGEIGWLATGLKDPNLIKVGDTLALEESTSPLPGYKEPQPMVYAGFYLSSNSQIKKQDFENFRQALLKLKLNDYALSFSPESSDILGRGYRLGFLGVLHLKIIQERLKEEYGLDLIVTNPTVSYRLWLIDSQEPILINNPTEWPSSEKITKVEEPWAKIEIITPPQYLSNILNLINRSRGDNIETKTISDRLLITCELPLDETIKNFYDNLKSASSGYASMDYKISGYRITQLEKLEVLLAGKKFESLSKIVLKDKVMSEGRELAQKLKELLPRQNYAVPIQVLAFGRIISRETLPALKKDVTGYLYGGDRTRKMKLWKKQKQGKKRLLEQANLEVPSEVFLKLFAKE
ncbi:MAG: elongation factor 4 [Parcubacteria group bacterium]|nr:elongation factor 4 [Parcubacteria group bacterium]